MVETMIVPIDSRYDALRPMVSAMTPVGTSQIICADQVDAVLTSMTSKRVSPPRWIRKMVLIAQISEVASVNSALVDRYAKTTLRGV